MRRLKLLVLIFVLGLGACSILQFVYHQAPKYFQWRANVAFHLDDSQYSMVKTSMRHWFYWQRKEQLPLMSAFLMRGQSDVMGDIPAALACKRRDEMDEWGRAGMRQAAPYVAQLILTLKPSQIEHLRDFFDDQNEEFVDDFLPEGREAQLDEMADFITKWTGLIYGDFSRQQKQQLVADLAKMPFNAHDILGQFKRFQTNFLMLIRQAQDEKWTQAQTETRVRAMLIDMVEPADPALNATIKRWIAAGCQTASAFHGRTTLKQRQAAAEQAGVWAKDFAVLAAE